MLRIAINRQTGDLCEYTEIWSENGFEVEGFWYTEKGWIWNRAGIDFFHDYEHIDLCFEFKE